jgi:hypothetical protein
MIIVLCPTVWSGTSAQTRDWPIVLTPAVFWVIGGIDPERYHAAAQAGRLDEIPANHAPDFAPVIHPTLRTGVEAMLTAAGAWLRPGTASPPAT